MTANIGVILYEYLGFLFCSSLSTVQAYSSQSVSVFSNTSVCSDALMINKDFIEIKSEVTYIEEVAQPGDRFTLEFINTSTNKTFKQCNFTYLDDCAKDNGLCVCTSKNLTFFKVLYRAPAIMEYNYSSVNHRGFLASRKIPIIVSDTVNVSLKVNNHDAVELPEGEPCRQSIRSHVGSKVFFKFCATGLHQPTLHISYTGRKEKSEEAECVFFAPVYTKSMVSATFRYEDKCNRTRTIECPFEEIQETPPPPEESTFQSIVYIVIVSWILCTIAGVTVFCFSKRPQEQRHSRVHSFGLKSHLSFTLSKKSVASDPSES